jgi:hypothetical protein
MGKRIEALKGRHDEEETEMPPFQGLEYLFIRTRG